MAKSGVVILTVILTSAHYKLTKGKKIFKHYLMLQI